MWYMSKEGQGGKAPTLNSSGTFSLGVAKPISASVKTIRQIAENTEKSLIRLRTWIQKDRFIHKSLVRNLQSHVTILSWSNIKLKISSIAG